MEVYAICQMQAESNQITFHVDSQLSIVNTDFLRYKLVLYILLQNAIKFTNSGKVNVQVKQSKKDPLKFKTKIIDTGKGIEQNRLNKIFQMYSQIEPDQTNLSTNGVGLGLSTCKAIVEYCGGTIQIKS